MNIQGRMFGLRARRRSGVSGPVTLSVPAGTTEYLSGESSGTSFTSGTLQFGAAASGKWVVVALGGRGNTASVTVSSVTIGGTSATEVLAANHHSGGQTTIAAIWAAQPAGSSGTVNVVYSGSLFGVGLQVFELEGATSLTAHDTGTDTQTASNPSTTIDIPADGTCLGVVQDNSGGSYTWTNLTEASDGVWGSGRKYSSASDDFASLQTARAISTTGGSSDVALAVASWGP